MPIAVATIVARLRQRQFGLAFEQRLAAHLRGEEAGLDRRRQVEAVAQRLDELDMAGRQAGTQGRQVALLRHVLGQHEVDAVGPALQPGLDIGKDLGHVVRHFARQAEHAEAACPCQLDNDIRRVREAEDG